MDEPFVAISPDELGDKLGATVRCYECDQEHEVSDSDPPLLQYFRCGDKLFACGVNGKRWIPPKRRSGAPASRLRTSSDDPLSVDVAVGAAGQGEKRR